MPLRQVVTEVQPLVREVVAHSRRHESQPAFGESSAKHSAPSGVASAPRKKSSSTGGKHTNFKSRLLSYAIASCVK